MNGCLNCGGKVEKDYEYCKDCAFVRLKKYIDELYEKQEKNKSRKS